MTQKPNNTPTPPGTSPTQKREQPQSNDCLIACSKCGEKMPVERRELLGVTTCIRCTKPKKKPIGVWDYPDNFHERVDGVGGLIILDQDE